jgi:Na+-transporting methylmalonyl-CoA/oxaloacetate decarboxylase gamma subunit
MSILPRNIQIFHYKIFVMDLTQIDTIAGAMEAVPSAIDDVNVFVDHDPFGLWMALLGMGIVFLILLLLYAVFSKTPQIFTFDFKGWISGMISSRRKATILPEKLPGEGKAADLSGEVNAAIAVAIHLYRSEMHDYENTVLTISKVSRTYSPWSSKIYGLRNLNR